MDSMVFFYGSLMSKRVLLRVLCGPNASEEERVRKINSVKLKSACLRGYYRSCVKNEDYPAIVYTGNMTDEVDGMTCEGLTSSDIKSLDIFEGHEYARKTVTVQHTDDSSIHHADAYVWIDNIARLSHNEWCMDHFIQTGKEAQWLDASSEFDEVDTVHFGV
ncbi:hypothetical protein BDB01DRAFT_768786 [Pilobolus umbonatus]|nr:hypothetical protein BDB01DRAFT_768786 [Pilobolus umbonatus]